MMVKGTFLFLGTGASLGVPIVGCKCPVCISKSPFNKRLRPSGLIFIKGKNFLIDATPDFRSQALRCKLERLDGVFFTHLHYDHIAGLDDLRIFYYIQKKSLFSLLSETTMEELKGRFYYLLSSEDVDSLKFDFHVLEEDFGSKNVEGIEIQYFSYFQKDLKVTGYRVGDFAYVVDIKEYSDELLKALLGVKNLVVSALREGPSSVHFGIADAIEFSKKVGAENTWFTHMSHDVDYEITSRSLPRGIKLAFDDLKFDFTYEE